MCSLSADATVFPLDDLGQVPIEQLENEISEFAAHMYAGTCRWLLLVAEFDRRDAQLAWGFASCGEWLSWRCSISRLTAREQVRVARRLAELPRMRTLFADGRLSYSKVRAITRVATAENEDYLTDIALHASAAQLERLVRSYRRVVDTELDEANRAHDRRYLSCNWDEDGSLRVRGRLSADEGALVVRALAAGREALAADREALAADHEALRTPNGQEEVSAETQIGRQPAESQTTSNADALALMAETLLAGGAQELPAGERHQVVVHVDAAALTHDAPEGACHLEDGPGLPAEAARRLACDGSLVRIIERDGRPLSVGRRTRAIPPALRRALASRDDGCRFPGCNRRRVDAHHIRHWAHGGETKLSNLVQVCRRHHRLLHEGGYSVEPDGDAVRFRRPDGRLIAYQPCSGDAQRVRAINTRRRTTATIDSETCVPISAGERMDYGMAVEGLLEHDGLLGSDWHGPAPPA